MGATKPFKTLDEQIELLKSRGLAIDDEEKAKQLLLKSRYYNVVNGYASFIQSTSDVYHQGANFAELYALYMHDKALKHIFFNKIIKVEQIIKSYITYVFSESYQQRFAYLNSTNFVPDRPLEVAELIAKLSKFVAQPRRGADSINHYKDFHKYVPLWVLVNDLDFGTIEFFFKLMKQQDKHKVVRLVNDCYNKSYDNEHRFKASDIAKCLANIRQIRNICAHDARLIKAKCNRHIPYIKYLHDRLKIANNVNRQDVYNVYVVLQIFLTKAEYDTLTAQISNKMQHLQATLISIDIDTINKAYGFPTSWSKKIA